MRLFFYCLLLCLMACGGEENFHKAVWPDPNEADSDFWFSPSPAWQLKDGSLELRQQANYHQCVWRSIALDSSSLRFRTSVDVSLTQLPAQERDASWIGFSLGLQQAAVSRDSAGYDHGIAMGVTPGGRLFVGKPDEYNQMQLPEKFRLEARGLQQRDGKYYIFLEVFRADDRMIGQRIVPVHPSWLKGLPALTVSNSLPRPVIPWEQRPTVAAGAPPAGVPTRLPNTKQGLLANFENWEISGPRIQSLAK